MTRLPIWALVPILVVLVACSGQTPIPAATPTSVAVTAEPSSITPSTTNIIPTPQPQGTPESTAATATPTPASSKEAATSIPTQAADGRCTALRRKTGDYSGDHCRPCPNGHRGVQPVPMEALGRRGWRLPRRPAGGPHLGEPRLRSPLSPKGNAGSKRAGGTVHSLASTSRRLET